MTPRATTKLRPTRTKAGPVRFERTTYSSPLMRIGGCRAVHISLDGDLRYGPKSDPQEGRILHIPKVHFTRLNSISSSFLEFLNLGLPSLMGPTRDVFSTCLSTQQFTFQSGIRTSFSRVTLAGMGNRS